MNINLPNPIPLDKPDTPIKGDVYHDIKSGSIFIYDDGIWKEVILTGKIDSGGFGWKKDFRKEKIDNIWHR